MQLRRLHPDPGPVTAAEATSGLRLGDMAPPDRPYLVLNMVETLDGRVAVDGRSGPIGNAADRELFHGLRTQVDAVMAGAGTVRTERYGRMVKSDELRERRLADGLSPDPIACVVSARLNLPSDLPLLQDPDSHVVVLTASSEDPPDGPARCECLVGSTDELGALELAPLLRRLREGLVDELWLALAPKLTAGEALTVVTGAPLRPPVELELLSLLESESNLFMRYRVSA